MRTVGIILLNLICSLVSLCQHGSGSIQNGADNKHLPFYEKIGDGEMNNMGMKMSLQQMDMNTVMYPEIKGSESTMKNSMTSMDMSNM